MHDPLLLRAELDDVLAGADVVAMLVAHGAYRGLEPAAVGRLVRGRRVLDATHALARADWERAGFTFVSLAERVRAAEATRN